jgi:hypothetical protein
MRFLPLAALATTALLAAAPAATADELDLGLRFRGRDGGVALGLRLGEPRPAPIVVRHRHEHDDDCRLLTIPGHTVVRLEEVCEPAVYETRRVPVYEDRRVPVYETVETPVFDLRFDAARGVRVRARIGERRELVQVGERVERVRVGDRLERVLVRAATCRTVERREWVGARTVLVCERPNRHRHPGLEVMSRGEYEAEMAAVLPRGDVVRRRVARGR